MDKNSDGQDNAMRHNAGKPKWSLVDFESLEPMVEVLEYGAKKYDDFNWTKGFPYRDLTESLLRHVFSFLSGEDTDKESGLSHVGHIQANAMFLAYNIKHHKELDNRHNII